MGIDEGIAELRTPEENQYLKDHFGAVDYTQYLASADTDMVAWVAQRAGTITNIKVISDANSSGATGEVKKATNGTPSTSLGTAPSSTTKWVPVAPHNAPASVTVAANDVLVVTTAWTGVEWWLSFTFTPS